MGIFSSVVSFIKNNKKTNVNIEVLNMLKMPKGGWHISVKLSNGKDSRLKSFIWKNATRPKKVELQEKFKNFSFDFLEKIENRKVSVKEVESLLKKRNIVSAQFNLLEELRKK